MSYPFGGHPTFARLKERLEALGCAVQKLDGKMIGPDGEEEIVFAQNKANGKFVVLPNMPEDEYLAPSMVESIERGLGVETGFASAPH